MTAKWNCGIAATAAVIVVTGGLIAALVPAWRAANTEPVSALRPE